MGLESTRMKVVRGGAWLYPQDRVRSDYRGHLRPEFRVCDLGFRVVQQPSSKKPDELSEQA